MRRRRTGWVGGPSARVALLAALTLLVGCDSALTGGLRGPRLWLFVPSSVDELTTSVTRAFTEGLETTPIPISQSAAGSQTLRLQIESGSAPADVFISADVEHMRVLHEAGRVRDVRTFAYNGLALVVPASNPAGIDTFWDLPRAERIVIGTEEVPIGRYTRQALARAAAARPAAAGEAGFDAQVMARVASLEANVRLVRSKVELAEADAAIVYRTDALGRPGLRAIPVPPEVDVLAEYQVGLVVHDEGRRDGDVIRAHAEAWVAFLLSEAGRRIVAEHGFTVPR